MELLASTVITADGATAGTAITDGANAALLTVAVTAYTQSAAGSSVKVYIDRRATSSDLWVEGETLTFTATGTQVVGVELGALTRVRWDVTNMTDATLQVAGPSTLVYCSPSELTLAIVEKAIAELTLTEKVKACITATDTVNGYLQSYVLPLVSWTSDLTLKVGYIAAAILVTQRGADITGPDSLVYLERDKAISWLNLIAAGRLRPPGIVDSTPEVFDAGAVVTSLPRRCW